MPTCDFTPKPLSIFFGGKSPEHVASRESFSFVYENLQKAKRINLLDIYYFDVQNNVFHAQYDRNLCSRDYIDRRELIEKQIAFKKIIDSGAYVLNLLHGRYGEDGHMQGLAGMLGISGSFGSVLPACLAMSKVHMSHYVSSAHPLLKQPLSLTIRDVESDTAMKRIRDIFGSEDVVVKPNSLGASLFTEKYSLCAVEDAELIADLAKLFEYDSIAVVQQFIPGTEYSIGCIQQGPQTIALPAVRIDTTRGFFGHREKHRVGCASETVVTEDNDLTTYLKKIAIDIFEGLQFSHMCRFDFIVTNDSKVYFLEANPIPGLMRNSIFPKMLSAASWSIEELIIQFQKNQFYRQEKSCEIDYVID